MQPRAIQNKKPGGFARLSKSLRLRLFSEECLGQSAEILVNKGA